MILPHIYDMIQIIHVYFKQPIRSEKKFIAFKEYFDGKCLFCTSKVYVILKTWTRVVQDLGNPYLKNLIEIEQKRVKCSECGMNYTPENPLIPVKYEYSLAVISYSLYMAVKKSQSSYFIAETLKDAHNVDISPRTVQEWVNHKTEEYFLCLYQENPEDSLKNLKCITVDGTYFAKGKDLIGKKKDAEFASVIKLKENLFFVTWWT